MFLSPNHGVIATVQPAESAGRQLQSSRGVHQLHFYDRSCLQKHDNCHHVCFRIHLQFGRSNTCVFGPFPFSTRSLLLPSTWQNSARPSPDLEPHAMRWAKNGWDQVPSKDGDPYLMAWSNHRRFEPVLAVVEPQHVLAEVNQSGSLDHATLFFLRALLHKTTVLSRLTHAHTERTLEQWWAKVFPQEFRAIHFATISRRKKRSRWLLPSWKATWPHLRPPWQCNGVKPFCYFIHLIYTRIIIITVTIIPVYIYIYMALYTIYSIHSVVQSLLYDI